MTDKKVPARAIRLAATVILVREKDNALEVYLLKRSTKSGFMGGLYVFPGGVVDPEDRGIDVWAPCIDITPEQVDDRLGGKGISLDDALGFSIAAIRETLEEAGVFIASRENKTPKDLERITSYRLNTGLPKSWFQTRIEDENWTLSLSSLGRWSHWITPKLMKKRFDTRFFIVFMPDGQTCVPDNMETKEGLWITPEKALEKNLETTVPLSPPTIVTLTQLKEFKSLKALKQEIKTRLWGDPIAPRLVPSSNGPVIMEPWDAMCDTDSSIDTSVLSNKILAPGSAFSRIWCDKGVWKPVGI